MISKNNFWKVSKPFVLAVIAATFSSSLSQAIEVQKQAISEPAIEERLSRIRTALKQRKKLNAVNKYQTELSLRENSVRKENKLFLSQYWPNWSNNWNDWSDWNNWDNQSEWNDWSDWNKWDNWSEWNDWSDWNNWSNWDNWF